MRSIRRHRCAFGILPSLRPSRGQGPGIAGGGVTSGSISGSGTLMMSSGTAKSGTASPFNSATAQLLPRSSSTSSSSLPASPWAPTYGNGTNTPLNLSGSSEGSGSEGGGGSGGGLVWGEPLSADVATFGKVHTNLRYFSQSSSNGTQQAVGINFTLRY